MGLLETLKENREKNKLFKIERQEKNSIARAKAQAAYDIEFQKGAVEAVKSRARREATERFGYSKKERRARSMENFAREMGGIGNVGANMGGDIFGNPSPRRSSGSHRKKTGSGSHTHIHIHTGNKKHRASHRKQKEKDPFDLSDLGF